MCTMYILLSLPKNTVFSNPLCFYSYFCCKENYLKSPLSIDRYIIFSPIIFFQEVVFKFCVFFWPFYEKKVLQNAFKNDTVCKMFSTVVFVLFFVFRFFSNKLNITKNL